MARRKTMKQKQQDAACKLFGFTPDSIVPDDHKSRLACFLLGWRAGYRAGRRAGRGK